MISFSIAEVDESGSSFDSFDFIGIDEDRLSDDQPKADSADFDVIFNSRSHESDSVRDIALTLLIQAARDIDRGRKVDPLTGMVISRSPEAERAEMWLEYIDEGKFPFSLVCLVLWGDEICAQTIGDAIIINPTIASTLEIPRAPQFYQFLRSRSH